MFSLIIKNAYVIDGSGKPGALMDVAIEDNQIVAIKPEINSTAHSIYDAKAMVLAPGFIDIQNHSDSYWQLFNNPTLDSLTTQGYTTILVGSSGTSLAPLLSKESILSVQKWESTMGLNVNWRSFEEYKQTLRALSFGCNVASLVGYSTVRRGMLGDRTTTPSQEELIAIIDSLETALKEGAMGISVGLSYSHELNVSATELVALANLCVKTNKILSVALRNEAENLAESVRELAALAEQTGVRLKISHLKVRYRENWEQLVKVLEEMENVWHRGASIHFDVYPYTHSWQPLYTYLPSWSLEGGRSHLLQRLKDPTQRKKISSSLINHPAQIGEFIVASTVHRLKVVGKTINQIAKDLHLTSEEAMLNLIEHGGSQTLIFDKFATEEVVQNLSTHALGFIATNGGGFADLHEDRLVHPRCFGTSAKFLRYVLDSKAISLEEAIRKLTTAPADKLNLPHKGRIEVGSDADLVLFDPQTINSQATLVNPYRYAEGIRSVWVGGVQVAANGKPTQALPGKFIE